MINLLLLQHTFSRCGHVALTSLKEYRKCLTRYFTKLKRFCFSGSNVAALLVLQIFNKVTFWMVSNYTIFTTNITII
jgi:hypothetical protein